MSKTARDIMELIQKEDIKMVDFKMVDINGVFRHVTIPAANFNEDTMVNGIGFDASLHPGSGYRCYRSLL